MAGFTHHDPVMRLALACRVAALRIEHPGFRTIAARQATGIPVSRMEMGNHPKADMARMGRRLLMQLPDMAPADWPDAAMRLRACANAIASRFEETDVQRLGPRRRSA